jgi:CheY-like chemotaxis protein
VVERGDERPALLLVDDDAVMRRLVKTTLRGAPVRVVEADNALDALNAARREQPRVAVLDIGLGREDGVRLCQSLKTSEATRDVRIVMLSGRDDATTRARARRAGAEAFLAKPFSPLALWRTLEQMLAG